MKCLLNIIHGYLGQKMSTVDIKRVSNINLATSYKNDIKIYNYIIFKKQTFNILPRVILEIREYLIYDEGKNKFYIGRFQIKFYLLNYVP